MFFSVIIPVYNTQAYLARAINSILEQDYSGSVEIILIDDGSTDGSEKTCDEFAAKYENVLTIHKSNGGQSSARNLGLEIAKGEYIAFLDSDDWFDKDAFSVFHDILSKHKVSALSFGYKMRDGGGEVIGKSETKTSRLNIVLGIDEFLKTDSFGPAPWQEIYSRAFLNNLHLRFLEGVYHEDELFTAQASCCAENVYVIGYNGYNYFQSENSTMRKSETAHIMKRVENLVLIIDKLYEFKADFENDPIRKRILTARIIAQNFAIFRNLHFGNFPREWQKRIYEKLKRNKLYPLPAWRAGIRYRFYRFLTILHCPHFLIKFIYRRMPIDNPLWDKIQNLTINAKRIFSNRHPPRS
jgi:glycosyltransferase involved in cell wall biosynthesis